MSTPSVSEEWKLDTDFVKALSEYNEQSDNDQKLVHMLDIFLASQGPVAAILKLAPPSTPAPVILLIYNICEVAKKHLKLKTDIVALGKIIVDFMTQAIIIYNASQEFVNDAAFTDAMWHRASDVKKVLDEIMEWVKNYKERTTMQKIRHSFDDEVGEIVRLKGKLGQALLTFGALGHMDASRAFDQVIHLAKNPKLQDKLGKGNELGAPVPSRVCAAYTRLSDDWRQVEGWVKADNEKPLFWLMGGAGTGKSTIAATISEMQDRSSSLVCRFFCGKGITSIQLFKNLAYQLSELNEHAQTTLLKALSKEPNLHRLDAETAKTLLTDPLAAVLKTKSVSLILIVIDALDRCPSQTEILEHLLKAAEHLNNLKEKKRKELRIKILLTSRPSLDKPDLEQFESLVDRRYLSSALQNVLTFPLYFKDELNSKNGPEPWDTFTPDIHAISADMNGLWICAASAASYLRKELKARLPDRWHSIKEDVKKYGMRSVDKLYQDILDEVYGSDAIDLDYQNFRNIVGALINWPDSRRPIFIPHLQKHFPEMIHNVHYVLTNLQCILELRSEKLDDLTPLVILPSFVDFITADNPPRCRTEKLKIVK